MHVMKAFIVSINNIHSMYSTVSYKRKILFHSSTEKTLQIGKLAARLQGDPWKRMQRRTFSLSTVTVRNPHEMDAVSSTIRILDRPRLTVERTKSTTRMTVKRGKSKKCISSSCHLSARPDGKQERKKSRLRLRFLIEWASLGVHHMSRSNQRLCVRWKWTQTHKRKL